MVNNNMIMGDRKIKMSESDFIELITRIDSIIEDCPFDDRCIGNCTECWAKKLGEFIDI